jgi:hypothetical protein
MAISVDGDLALLPMPRRNVHVDVNDWRTGTAADTVTGTAADTVSGLRGVIGAARLRRLRLVKRSAPVGIHFAHDAASW